MPNAIYEAERRDLHRGQTPGARLARLGPGSATSAQSEIIATVENESYQGVRLKVPANQASLIEDVVSLEFVDGDRRGEKLFGQVRYRQSSPDGTQTALGYLTAPLARSFARAFREN